MSASRVAASINGRVEVPVRRSRRCRGPRPSRVLAERNQAVVAVGAWVENGQDFFEHPSALALLTEELQAERRRENEESLRRFQDEVRHRVAQRTQIFKKTQQPQAKPVKMKPDRRVLQQQYHEWSHVSADERAMSEGGATRQRAMQGSSQEVGQKLPRDQERLLRIMLQSHRSENMKQVRLRLAACRMIPHGEVTTDLPGGKWNISRTSHKAAPCMLRVEQDEEEEEEEDVEGDGEEEEEEEEEGGGDDDFFTSGHECPLVEQKMSGCVLWDTKSSQPDSGFKSKLRNLQALWPLDDQEELKRQRQSQFLMHRRHFMNIEREQVKENKLHRKHEKRTARIKAEREQIRLEEERKLERIRQLADARQKFEERELLILERLKLEEDERAVELQRRKKQEKGKVAARFIEALRAQMKERLSQEKLELPPLCCCASSFWDSHPDTCANNCVFHNNPKAYAQALHSTMLSLDSR